MKIIKSQSNKYLQRLEQINKRSEGDIEERKQQREMMAEKLELMAPGVASKIYLKPREGIVFLTDWSDSMSGKKETALKTTLKELAPKVGVKRWFVRFPRPESDEQAFEFNIEDIDKMSAGGGTPMGHGLETAWGFRPEIIVLITDGQPTDATQDEIKRRTKRHKSIPIYCFGIGDPDYKDLDESFLKDIASITGGHYYRITEKQVNFILKKKVEDLLLEYNDGELRRNLKGYF